MTRNLFHFIDQDNERLVGEESEDGSVLLLCTAPLHVPKWLRKLRKPSVVGITDAATARRLANAVNAWADRFEADQ